MQYNLNLNKMKNENVGSVEPVIGDETPESNGFDHNNENIWESIGLDPDSLDKNMEKFCEAMNQYEGGGKVSEGVENVMKIFSYKEVCFLAFKGLEIANTLGVGL